MHSRQFPFKSLTFSNWLHMATLRYYISTNLKELVKESVTIVKTCAKHLNNLICLVCMGVHCLCAWLCTLFKISYMACYPLANVAKDERECTLHTQPFISLKNDINTISNVFKTLKENIVLPLVYLWVLQP